MTSNHCHSKYHSGVNIIICVLSALWRSSPLRSMAQSHPGMDINSSNSSPREASPVSLPTPIRLVSISLSSGMDMKEKTEDAQDEEPKQEGGKSHGGAIPLQIDEAAAPSPSSKARAQPRPWWLSILFVTLSFIVIASVLVAIIMRYHEGILTAARWCQERQPWSIILNGCIIVGANILGFPTMPIEDFTALRVAFKKRPWRLMLLLRLAFMPGVIKKLR
ncbi:hypothetical protein Naga_101205g2 [Nannochloropsis gaditana]|uniref:Uncharacterized protein n=1 Tax=Nannochloropsis gaditana TaxID=72520 RepID=W7U2Q2_9STRA|nr:hypothetical protein Naga_101205g2 [Nannochloropsis gaditana]